MLGDMITKECLPVWRLDPFSRGPALGRGPGLSEFELAETGTLETLKQ